MTQKERIIVILDKYFGTDMNTNWTWQDLLEECANKIIEEKQC